MYVVILTMNKGVETSRTILLAGRLRKHLTISQLGAMGQPRAEASARALLAASSVCVQGHSEEPLMDIPLWNRPKRVNTLTSSGRWYKE